MFRLMLPRLSSPIKRLLGEILISVVSCSTLSELVLVWPRESVTVILVVPTLFSVVTKLPPLMATVGELTVAILVLFTVIAYGATPPLTRKLKRSPKFPVGEFG